LKLAEAAARAAEAPDERALADLRRSVADDLEAAARSGDFRERAVAYRAIGRDTLTLLEHLGAEADEPDLRATASSVHRTLKLRAAAR